MTPTTFTYRFKLILKKNGLPQELNVHSLRHTAASLMIAGGTDVATVAGILGHRTSLSLVRAHQHRKDAAQRVASCYILFSAGKICGYSRTWRLLLLQ